MNLAHRFITRFLLAFTLLRANMDHATTWPRLAGSHSSPRARHSTKFRGQSKIRRFRGFPATLHVERFSPSDLELGGELAGLPAGATRYIGRDALLALPQASYTVTGDPNFAGPTQISGVLLEELIRHLGATPDSDLMVAICADQYHSNYPRHILPLIIPCWCSQSTESHPRVGRRTRRSRQQYGPLYDFASQLHAELQDLVP